ncbi:MAG: hypothetical protein ABSC25_28185, partial [Roseiarcus sp.]
KADFLLPLKGNQPTMEAEVGAYFDTAPEGELVSKTAVEKGHGRIETRLYTASKEVEWRCHVDACYLSIAVTAPRPT